MATAADGAKAEDKRLRLSAAGVELLEEFTYSDITVSMIAERANMARGLVFYYFGDKERYFQEVVRVFLNQQREAFAANDPAAASTPQAWLTREVRIFLEMMSKYPKTMQTIAERSWTSVADPEGRTITDFTVDRVRQVYGVSADDMIFDIAAHSWGLHTVDFALRLLQAGQMDQECAAAVLIAELNAIVTTLAPDAPSRSSNGF